jgi:hypothetical protein
MYAFAQNDGITTTRSLAWMLSSGVVAVCRGGGIGGIRIFSLETIC